MIYCQICHVPLISTYTEHFSPSDHLRCQLFLILKHAQLLATDKLAKDHLTIDQLRASEQMSRWP